jgi:hypothetical protein
MPDLGAKQSTSQVDLPSSTPEDPAFVVLKHKLTLGDFAAVQEAEGPFQQGVALLCRVISDWSFTLNGEKAPITTEVLELLDSQDFIFLSKWVEANIKIDDAAVSNEQKKSFQSTLATSSTETTPSPTESPKTTIPIN